ncbi:helicase [Vagococcus xieshaowenii]|uniref:Helicase n=1 Tax=Vagococcus xieshaowenii TaxID=2562451 RepID=A0AAJ5JQZ5_9ENTE|nr:helicase [Vagococcus xieshaowenii]QCA28971.1 helicase [Vagococcus xieshaowenii]TFZ43151.1 helicase [Vagococcus xieshaowenii]
MKIIQLTIGGMDKKQLIATLEEKQVFLNPLGHQLLEQLDDFKFWHEQTIRLVEVTVAKLGLSQGGTLLEVFISGIKKGFALCEVEIAALLSLDYNYLEDSIGLISTGKAPTNSVTIASKILIDTDDFPKGFYMRKIDNVCWLRGYTCDHLHVFAPEDRFMFLIN